MKRTLLAVVFLVVFFAAHAQKIDLSNASKEYVLINAQPYLVYVEPDGTILQYLRPAPEILKDLSPALRKELELYQSDKPTVFSDYFINSTSNNSTNIEQAKAGAANLAFLFLPMKARLNKENVQYLKEISSKYKAGEITSIKIVSHIADGNTSAKELAENRLAACTDLLKAFGVPANAITSLVDTKKISGPQVLLFFNS